MEVVWSIRVNSKALGTCEVINSEGHARVNEKKLGGIWGSCRLIRVRIKQVGSLGGSVDVSHARVKKEKIGVN